MKRLLILAAAAVGVIAVLLLAAPFLISTDFVKRQIAGQITTWTGRDVSFAGEPEIRLLPDLTVRLRKVVLANPPEMADTPFLQADLITGRLRLLPLLAGRIEVAEFRLFGPRISFVVDRDGRANWHFDRSAVGAQAAKRDAEVISDDIAPPSPLADISLGRLVIRNGSLSFDDRRSGRHEELSDVKVNLAWPSTQDAATGEGTFIYRGEPVEFNGSIAAPLQLLAGGASPARIALASTLLRASFVGTAGQLDGLQIEGETTVTTPSVRRVAEWMGAAPGSSSILGAGSIAGTMNWIGPSIAFSAAKVELDGNAADGAFAVSIGERPGIQGTLALEKLDLTAYVEALKAAAAAGDFAPEAPVFLPLAGLGDLDLRLSTDQVIIGSTLLGRAAVAANAADGKLTITVGDAEFYGGNGEATLSAGMDGGALTASAEIAVDEVPAAAALAGILGASALDATGAASLDLAASGRTWGELAASLTGRGTLTLEGGTLAGIDVAELPGALQAGGEADGSGSTAFTAASATLQFAGLSVASTDIHAEGAAFALDLAGKASLADPAIEARGVLTLTGAGGGEAANEVPFMVTGTWTAPAFLPDLGKPFRPGESLPATVTTPGESPRG
jgi:uncharacterized protein involved in outer membrane biogenesis